MYHYSLYEWEIRNCVQEFESICREMDYYFYYTFKKITENQFCCYFL